MRRLINKSQAAMYHRDVTRTSRKQRVGNQLGGAKGGRKRREFVEKLGDAEEGSEERKVEKGSQSGGTAEWPDVNCTLACMWIAPVWLASY